MRKVTYWGEERKFCDLVREKEIPYITAYQRLRNGWSVEDTFDIPLIKKQQKMTQEEKLTIEKKKITTLKYDENNYMLQKGRLDTFVEQLSTLWNEIELPQMIRSIGFDKPQEIENVILLSDMHFGADFETPTNIYNEIVFLERLEKIKNYIISEKMDKVKIINTGDAIQGMLRLNDLTVNQFTVVQSIIKLCRHMANFLNDISRYCYVEYYNVPTANHSELRFLNAKAGTFAQESVELILIAHLQDVLKNNNRIFIYDDFVEDTVQLDIFGHNIIAMHGHQISKKDFKTIHGTLSNKYQKFIDIILIGHYHSGSHLVTGEGKHIIVAPSLVGTCPYARRLHVGARAEASHLIFDKSGLRGEMFIDLQD